MDVYFVLACEKVPYLSYDKCIVYTNANAYLSYDKYVLMLMLMLIYASSIFGLLNIGRQFLLKAKFLRSSIGNKNYTLNFLLLTLIGMKAFVRKPLLKMRKCEFVVKFFMCHA